jgi:protein ImuA
VNANDRAIVVQHLRNRLRQSNRSAGHGTGEKSPFSTGIAALDELLSADAFRAGMMIEWIVDGAGCGAARLALPMAIQSLQNGGALVVIDDWREFYPPAAVRLGLDLDRTIVIRPQSRQEVIWALEQALRCPGVAVTLSRVGHVHDRVLRRLQLAAEHGGGLGLLMRPAEARHTPGWADQRWLVLPLPGSASFGKRLRVELLHCRGGTAGRAVELEINDETGDVRVAPPLAAPAGLLHAAGA